MVIRSPYLIRFSLLLDLDLKILAGFVEAAHASGLYGYLHRAEIDWKHRDH